MKSYLSYTHVYNSDIINISSYYYSAEVLICFEAWAKLAQQMLVYVPLGVRLEPINKQLI